MEQTTGLSVQRGGGCEKTVIMDNTLGLDPIRFDYLIDAAVMKWVKAHPEEMKQYIDKDCICSLFGTSKVIYL